MVVSEAVQECRIIVNELIVVRKGEPVAMCSNHSHTGGTSLSRTLRESYRSPRQANIEERGAVVYISLNHEGSVILNASFRMASLRESLWRFH